MNNLIEALTLGILYGLGPCTLFCAPILIPLVISTARNGKEGIIQTFSFGFGRILSYSFLGLVSGYSGYLLSDLLSKELIGVFVFLLGFLILLRKNPQMCLISKIKSNSLSFFSGLIVGLGPCYPLLALLSLAVLTKSWLAGLLMGFVFGIGSLITPLILFGFLAGKWAGFSKKIENINTIVSALFLIFFGLLKILT